MIVKKADVSKTGNTMAAEAGEGSERGDSSGDGNTQLHSNISYTQINLCNLNSNLGASSLNSLSLNRYTTYTYGTSLPGLLCFASFHLAILNTRD